MNLADIRKKAQESRPSQYSSAAGVAMEPEVPQNGVIDSFSSMDSEPVIDLLWEVDSALNVSSCHAVPEEDLSPHASEPVVTGAYTQISPGDLLAEGPELKSQSVSLPLPVRSLEGFNPLDTILAGRESAADLSENPFSGSFLYPSEEIEEHLCFRVAHEEYAINIMAIKEIIKPREATEVPRMPLFISGVISLRGVVVPVMDMRLRLSLPINALTGRERIVVLRRDTGFCGILVDEVIQVARVRKSDIEPPPAVLDGIDREFVSGLGHFDNRMLILLNLETVLNVGVH